MENELREALHNLIMLARPHFSDETQMLALQQAEDALAALSRSSSQEPMREALEEIAEHPGPHG